MSLSAWEQQALNSIKDGLADSDPELVAQLTTLTELASGQEMPAREKIRASSRRVIQRWWRTGRRRGRARAHRVRQRLILRYAPAAVARGDRGADRHRGGPQPWRRPGVMHGILVNALCPFDPDTKLELGLAWGCRTSRRRLGGGGPRDGRNKRQL